MEYPHHCKGGLEGKWEDAIAEERFTNSLQKKPNHRTKKQCCERKLFGRFIRTDGNADTVKCALQLANCSKKDQVSCCSSARLKYTRKVRKKSMFSTMSNLGLTGKSSQLPGAAHKIDADHFFW